MVKAYQSGHVMLGKFTLSGGSAVTLDVTNMEFDEMTQAHVIQNSSFGGRTIRIPGFGDSGGNVTADFDLTDPPYKTAPGVVSGARGVLGMAVAASYARYFSIPCIIEKVHYVIPGTNKLTYNFDWKEDAMSGTFTLPSTA